MDDFKKRSKYFIIIIAIYIIFSLLDDNKYNFEFSLSQYWVLIIASLASGTVYGAYRTHKDMHE